METPNFWPPEAEVPQTTQGLTEAVEEVMKRLAGFSDSMAAARDKYVNRPAQYDSSVDDFYDPDLVAYLDEVARYALAASRMSALQHLLMLKITQRLLPDPEEPFESGR